MGWNIANPHIHAASIARLYEEYGPVHRMAAEILRGIGAHLVYEQYPSLLQLTVAIYVGDMIYDIVAVDYTNAGNLAYCLELEERLHRLLLAWMPDFPMDQLEAERVAHVARQGKDAPRG